MPLRILAGLVVLGAIATAAGAAPEARKAQLNPGGNEAIRLPVPPPDGKLFGFHEEAWTYPNPAFTPAQAAAATRLAGGNTYRFGLDWRGVEPQRDQWSEPNWLRAQRMYQALTDRGIKPVITIGFAPAWARDDPVLDPFARTCTAHRGCEYPPARAMLDEWEEFAAEVARRFPLAAIEIWNEPNIENFWRPRPDPERYAELLAHAHAAIKAVNPRATVLGGALASSLEYWYDAGGNPTVIPMRDFLDRAYEANPGIGGNMDALSFHFVFQQVYMGEGSSLAKAFKSARRSSAAHGDRRLRFWITEAALSTTGWDGMSERDQAEGLLRQYRRMLTMPDVDAYLIHTLYERYEVPADDQARGHGVLLSVDPIRPKRAFCEFANRAGTPSAQTHCRRGVLEPYPRLWRTAKPCTRALVGARRQVIRAARGERHGRERRYARLLRACVASDGKRRCGRSLRKLQLQILFGRPELELKRIEAHQRLLHKC